LLLCGNGAEALRRREEDELAKGGKVTLFTPRTLLIGR